MNVLRNMLVVKLNIGLNTTTKRNVLPMVEVGYSLITSWRQLVTMNKPVKLKGLPISGEGSMAVITNSVL